MSLKYEPASESGHEHHISSVDFSPDDGSKLASALGLRVIKKKN